MAKREKIFMGISIFLTVLFVGFGASIFFKSYVRLWETLGDFWTSLQYYFCEIFSIEHNVQASVTDRSNVLEWGEKLPQTQDRFWLKARVYVKLFFSVDNVKGYASMVGVGAGNVARALVLFLPLVLLLALTIKKMYSKPNVKHNRDTKPLRAFKWVAGKTYQPIKRFVTEYFAYINYYDRWKSVWALLWIMSLNLASIAVAFVAYYL